MYGFFKGRVDTKLNDRIILDVNDIGYEIFLPENQMETLDKGSNIKVYTHLHVREDDMKLFGFLSFEELEFFKKLISVSGVGPKMAMGIISNIPTSKMCLAIATDDVTSLKGIPGIGPKMAQKIIFELRDKVIAEQLKDTKEIISNSIKENKNFQEALAALQVLGYTAAQVKEASVDMDIENESVENIIRKILSKMQKI